jgi:hypothetical protein
MAALARLDAADLDDARGGSEPIRFELDTQHRSYDPAAANAFFRARVNATRVRALPVRVRGQAAPAFLLGQLRPRSDALSGRRAPERPGADDVTREAYCTR